jgi:hypothetical protein
VTDAKAFDGSLLGMTESHQQRAACAGRIALLLRGIIGPMQARQARKLRSRRDFLLLPERRIAGAAGPVQMRVPKTNTSRPKRLLVPLYAGAQTLSKTIR